MRRATEQRPVALLFGRLGGDPRIQEFGLANGSKCTERLESTSRGSSWGLRLVRMVCHDLLRCAGHGAFPADEIP